MSLDKAIIIGLAVLLLAASGAILWQRAEIKELEASQADLKLSNESFQQQKERDDAFIKDLGSLTIKKMQDAEKLAKDFDAISRKYRSTHTVPIKKGEVLPDDLRQELRKDISKPLPFPATHGM